MSTQSTDSPRIETVDLSVHFDHRSALDSISLAFDQGDIVSLVGPNGAGKSTLLRTLAGLLEPSHGYVLLDGQRVSGPEDCIIYVPQRSSVDWTFPISVLDVVLMARRSNRSRFRPYTSRDKTAARTALQMVEMESLASVQISQLSGGQQQRVFLARSLLDNGDVYLLDEPFTGVDIPTQSLLIELFHSLGEEGKTVLFATHDLQQAFESASRVVMLNRTVVADGLPDEVGSPENLRRAYGALAPPFENQFGGGAQLK